MAGSEPQADPRILGITGPIGCGKTTVGDILLELGALERIDADRIVHDLMGPNTPTSQRVRDTFGDGVMTHDGSVNRFVLASVVFSNSDCLRTLEAIVHPEVREAIRSRVAELRGQDGVMVIDAIRLLQSDLLPLVESVWVVSCPLEAQVQRLTSIRRMTSEAVEGRLAAQPSFEHPCVARVIWNSGSLSALRREVTAAWGSFLARGDDATRDS